MANKTIYKFEEGPRGMLLMRQPPAETDDESSDNDSTSLPGSECGTETTTGSYTDSVIASTTASESLAGSIIAPIVTEEDKGEVVEWNAATDIDKCEEPEAAGNAFLCNWFDTFGGRLFLVGLLTALGAFTFYNAELAATMPIVSDIQGREWMETVAYIIGVVGGVYLATCYKPRSS